MTVTSPVYTGDRPLSVWSDSRLRPRLTPPIFAPTDRWYRPEPVPDEPAVVTAAPEPEAWVGCWAFVRREEWYPSGLVADVYDHLDGGKESGDQQGNTFREYPTREAAVSDVRRAMAAALVARLTAGDRGGD